MAAVTDIDPKRTAEIERVRRRRSIAIAIALAALAAIFYAVSMVKML